MGVEQNDIINFTTFRDGMNLYADRTGQKYTKAQINTMFEEADWYRTGEIEMSELVEVCSQSFKPCRARKVVPTRWHLVVLTPDVLFSSCACSLWKILHS